MSSDITAYEKGLALEQRLVQLFRGRGYDVEHNVKIVGRSGTEHQIDLLVRFDAPLHTSKIIIEAKSYQGSIDKDKVMKLIQIVDDLGADRGIIITTSWFTPGALTTAEGHNVELWDRERLGNFLGEIEIAAVEKGLPEQVTVLETAVRPRLNFHELKARLAEDVEKKRRGGFLGMGKVLETLESLALYYYPYYEARVDVQLTETERAGLLKKKFVHELAKTTVSVDAITGVLIEVSDMGISYSYSYLANLTAEEVALLRAVGSRRFDSASVLALGYSEGKGRKLVNTLVGKKVIERVATRPAAYKSTKAFPSDPRSLKSITETLQVEEQAQADDRIFSGSRKDPSAIITALRSYWSGALVESLNLIYNPYFVAIYRRPDNSARNEIIDAITGYTNSPLAKLRWNSDPI